MDRGCQNKHFLKIFEVCTHWPLTLISDLIRHFWARQTTDSCSARKTTPVKVVFLLFLKNASWIVKKHIFWFFNQNISAAEPCLTSLVQHLELFCADSLKLLIPNSLISLPSVSRHQTNSSANWPQSLEGTEKHDRPRPRRPNGRWWEENDHHNTLQVLQKIF